MQARFKRFTALILSVLMMLTCLPMGAMAEETVIPTEDISVEVIPDDAEAAPEQETVPAMEAEILDPEETPASKTDLESDVQQDDPEETPSISEALPE